MPTEESSTDDEDDDDEIQLELVEKSVDKVIGVLANKTNFEPKQTKKSDKNDKKCEICNRFFTRKARLRSHINSIHLKQKPQECPICGYSTYHKYNLYKHMRAFHEANNKENNQSPSLNESSSETEVKFLK